MWASEHNYIYLGHCLHDSQPIYVAEHVTIQVTVIGIKKFILKTYKASAEHDAPPQPHIAVRCRTAFKHLQPLPRQTVNFGQYSAM